MLEEVPFVILPRPNIFFLPFTPQPNPPRVGGDEGVERADGGSGAVGGWFVERDNHKIEKGFFEPGEDVRLPLGAAVGHEIKAAVWTCSHTARGNENPWVILTAHQNKQ